MGAAAEYSTAGGGRGLALPTAEAICVWMVWFWVAFAAIVVALLYADLHVIGGERKVPMRTALIASAGYVAVALLFGAAISWLQGADTATEYFTVYVLEKALSLDNIFVFLVIFGYFKVPEEYRHRVLLFGVLGAIALRAAMIFAGAALLNAFEWVTYVFAAAVLASGVRMLFQSEAPPDPGRNPILRFLNRRMPMTDDYAGRRFFVRREGALCATPLFAVVVTIETVDLLFALDSIPAAFGITRDPFAIYTANIFAILGLRALYFAIAGMVQRFRYLHYGLAAVLIFVGIKLGAEALVHIPAWLMLGVTVAIIAVTMIASWLKQENAKP